MSKLDYCVYIGRFQPFHLGHYETIKAALNEAHIVIIVLGSANSPHNIKNPWSIEDRKAMIRGSFDTLTQNQIAFVDVEDKLYNNAHWALDVESKVNQLMAEWMDNPTVGIIGYAKEEQTANYPNQFKNWKQVTAQRFDVGNDTPLNATKIRELMFNGYVDLIKSALPEGSFNYVKQYTASNAFKELLDEYNDGVDYENKFTAFPKGYAINFMTTDAVVIQSGHILLVKRGHAPGKGLWALPGGHVNPSESILDAMIRELNEETEIKVPEKVIRGSIFCEKYFDHPDRSLRGRVSKKNARTVTFAFGIKLDDSAPLARVTGSDDAAEAWWFTFDQINKMRHLLFEDHYDIIQYMLARV